MTDTDPALRALKPRTEAGRRLLAALDGRPGPVNPDDILAIEAEAYAAGFGDMKAACHDEKAALRAALAATSREASDD